MPGDQRLAVRSLNYHTDFFGRAFNINVEGAGYAHSGRIGFGLECGRQDRLESVREAASRRPPSRRRRRGRQSAVCWRRSYRRATSLWVVG